MDVVRTIKPGDKGSHRFVKEYGDRLVAVRYRKDGRHRLTTVELIVEQRLPKQTIADIDAIEVRKLVPLRISFDEKELQLKIKQAGGFGDRKNKVWELGCRNAVALGLKDRIISSTDKK